MAVSNFAKPVGTEVNSMFHYKDKTFSNVAMGANFYKKLDNMYTDIGIPSGAYVLSYYIRGWGGSYGAISLASSNNGNDLYLFSSVQNVTYTSVTVRVFYISGINID